MRRRAVPIAGARLACALLAAALLWCGSLASGWLAPHARAQEGATSLADIFRAGNQAYYEGEWDDAIESYERLAELGVDDADVWFNLGSAYARRGRHGRAMLAYERALRVRPGDAGALRGLDASRSALARRRADREGEAMVQSGPTMGEAIFGGFSPDTLAIAALAGDALLFGCLIALLFVRRERARVGLIVAGSLGALVLVVGAFGALVRTGALDPGEAAVVVRDRAMMREGPSGSAGERGRAAEGERAYVLERDGDWARVRLGSGREGWMAAADVVQVAP